MGLHKRIRYKQRKDANLTGAEHYRQGTLHHHAAVLPCAKCLFRIGFGRRYGAKKLRLTERASKTLFEKFMREEPSRKPVRFNQGSVLFIKDAKPVFRSPRLWWPSEALEAWETEWSGIREDDCEHWGFTGIGHCEFVNWYVRKTRTAHYRVNQSAWIAHRMRNYVSQAIHAKTTKPWFLELVGCSVHQFKNYIESQFTRKMHWNNRGKVWHLDHIVPCNAFNLANDSQLKQCFHFSNHKPIPSRENLKKSWMVKPCQPELLITMNHAA